MSRPSKDITCARLHRQGVSMDGIMQQCGMSYSAVYSALRRSGFDNPTGKIEGAGVRSN